MSVQLQEKSGSIVCFVFISEVSSFKTDITTHNEEIDPRVQQVKQNVTLLANQTEAQGKMIRYLRDDIFQADSYIFDLEHQIKQLQVYADWL